jgi:hypothetical protein
LPQCAVDSGACEWFRCLLLLCVGAVCYWRVWELSVGGLVGWVVLGEPVRFRSAVKRGHESGAAGQLGPRCWLWALGSRLGGAGALPPFEGPVFAAPVSGHCLNCLQSTPPPSFFSPYRGDLLSCFPGVLVGPPPRFLKQTESTPGAMISMRSFLASQSKKNGLFRV